MYFFRFSYVWISELPCIWGRAADSVYHLSHLFTDVTLCCGFFPFGYCGRSLGSDCISSSLDLALLTRCVNPKHLWSWLAYYNRKCIAPLFHLFHA